VHSGFGLVGRDEERAELDRFLDGEGPAALAVRGDAGLGKSALAGELCRRAAAEGWRVLRAIGVEAEKPFTLGGLNQMVFGLRELVAGLDARKRDVLAPVFGADPAHAPQPMPLALALLELLDAAAADQPVLLAVDDVQWLDELSAVTLSVAGRRVTHPRVRILASYRPHAGAGFSPAGWTELVLGPLGAAEAARIVERTALPLSAGTRQAILDAAAGNPLALEELPRCADQIDAWTSSVPLTDRLVTVFGGRLQRLEPRVRAELLRAALDGARSGTAGDTGPRYSMTDVSAAVEGDLLAVDPLGAVVFRHPLVRAAVIHQAAAAERRDAHAHLARLYDDVLVRRAAHLSAASTEPDQAVADLLDQAARLSIRRGGAAVAVDWLRRAAELSSVADRREALLADAAFVAAQASRFDDAQALVDSGGDGSVAMVLTNAYLALYRDGEVLGAHRRLLNALGDAGRLDDATVVRVAKLLLAITMYAGDATLWRRTDDAVDRVADRLDALALIYRDAWGDLVRSGHTVGARLAEHRDSTSGLEPWEVMRLGVTAYYVDALADFRTELARRFDRERESGAVTNAMTMLHLLLLDQIASGRWADAQESARLGQELARTHHNELFRVQYTVYEGLRAASAGEVETARRCAAEVHRWAAPRRLGLLLGFVDRIAVLNALAEADYTAAHAAAARLAPAGEFPPYSHAAIEGLLDVVEAAVHAGHMDAARAHADAAVALRLGELSPRLDALVLAARAMTAGDAEADVRYRAAVEHPAVAAFPFEHCRIRLAYGRWLRRQRRTTQARAQLALAAEGFTALGACPWAERTRSELRAAGVTVQRAEVVALSAQEHRIAALAAAGHTNKQIAAQLYLSPRTVGAHLYRIFPKLGVTNRAGLSAALRALEPG
jgi:DNA-binding CsgD family transcriptional regulator